MDIFLQYVLSLIPTLIAIAGEIAVISKAISAFRKAKETDEYKALVEQNNILINELKESKKLNKELLTKIDRISRGE